MLLQWQACWRVLNATAAVTSGAQHRDAGSALVCQGRCQSWSEEQMRHLPQAATHLSSSCLIILLSMVTLSSHLHSLLLLVTLSSHLLVQELHSTLIAHVHLAELMTAHAANQFFAGF